MGCCEAKKRSRLGRLTTSTSTNTSTNTEEWTSGLCKPISCCGRDICLAVAARCGSERCEGKIREKEDRIPLRKPSKRHVSDYFVRRRVSEGAKDRCGHMAPQPATRRQDGKASGEYAVRLSQSPVEARRLKLPSRNHSQQYVLVLCPVVPAAVASLNLSPHSYKEISNAPHALIKHLGRPVPSATPIGSDCYCPPRLPSLPPAPPGLEE